MTPTRRTLLGSAAGLAGLVGLAGCGYRPAGGEFRWRIGVLYGVDRMTLDGGVLLLVTRAATSFDLRADRWSDGGNVATVVPERGERTAVYSFESPTLTAALGGDAVYAGLADGAVAAVPVEGAGVSGEPGGSDAGTATPGADGWTVSTDVAPSGVGALVVGDGGTVYAGGSGGLAALSRDGSVRWRWRDGSVGSAVPGRGDTAVLALGDDRLVALARDGSVRWTHDATPADTGPEIPPPLVGHEGVYLADGEGVTALAHDGSVRWGHEAGEPADRPALTGEGLYHASVDGLVRALSLGGRERWAHAPRGRTRSRVAAADGRAFVLAGGSLVGIGPRGTAWRVPLDEPERFIPEFGPFAVGETLVLADSGEVRSYWRSQLRR